MLFVYRYTSKQITCIQFIGATPQTPVNPQKFKIERRKRSAYNFNFIKDLNVSVKNCILCVCVAVVSTAQPPAHTQNAI